VTATEEPQLPEADATSLYAAIADVRIRNPRFVAEVASVRRRRTAFAGDDGRVFVLSADAAARGVIAVGADRTALARRAELLSRITTALLDERCDGVCGTADVIDDLLILDGQRKERGEPSILDGKLLIGSMNRGGLARSVFELDDAMTAYTVAGIAARGLDGAKAMLRLDLADAGTVRTLETVASVVDELAAAATPLFLEVLPVRRGDDGRVVTVTEPVEELITSVTIASGLGSDSSCLWMKIPAYPALADVARSTSCPVVILGGEGGAGGMGEAAAAALAAAPNVRGCMAGFRVLFPDGGDVAAAVAEVGAAIHS
jgi:hypothetical protein